MLDNLEENIKNHKVENFANRHGVELCHRFSNTLLFSNKSSICLCFIFCLLHINLDIVAI